MSVNRWVFMWLMFAWAPLIYAQDSVEGVNSLEIHKIDLVIDLIDLEIGDGAISVNVDGLFYPVSALKRVGHQWLATVDGAVNYCPQGHPMCSRCGLCHLKHCRYYVAPCWK